MIKKFCLVIILIILCGCENSSVLDTDLDYIEYNDNKIILEIYVKDFINQFKNTSCNINYQNIKKEWKEIEKLKAAPLYIDCGKELAIIANLVYEEGKLIDGVIKDWSIMSEKQISISIKNKKIKFNNKDFIDSGITEVLDGNCYIQSNLKYCEYDEYGMYIGDINSKLNYIKIVRYV